MRRMGVGIAVLVALSGCSGGGDDAAASTPAAVTLPGGQTATPEQAAFLEAVTPSLTDDHRRDVLAVLGEATSICEINPGRDWEIGVLKGAGYSLTEATVINDAAHQHLCPQG
jgi:hypothetical protein